MRSFSCSDRVGPKALYPHNETRGKDTKAQRNSEKANLACKNNKLVGTSNMHTQMNNPIIN